jgi:hypothetical protein
MLIPTKQPCGQERTMEETHANQTLHHHRLRIEPVNRSVKRCRLVKDWIRAWKEGIREVVMAICCALHNFRLRLTPGSRCLIGINLTATVSPPDGFNYAALPYLASRHSREVLRRLSTPYLASATERLYSVADFTTRPLYDALHKRV